MEEIIFGNKASDQIKKTPMYQGLSLLNDYLEAQNAPEMTFYIVGGFAMIAQGLRDGGVTFRRILPKNLTGSAFLWIWVPGG